MPGLAPLHHGSHARRSAMGGFAARRVRAFTMIELVVVIVLMSLLAAAVVPTLSTLGTQNNAAAARQIVRDIGYARERAMVTGTNTWLVISVSSNSYSILAESTSSPGRAGATTIDDPASGKLFVVRPGMAVSEAVAITAVSLGTGSEVGFDRLGRPIQTSGALMTSTGTITLTGGHAASIAAQTGRSTYLPGTY